MSRSLPVCRAAKLRRLLTAKAKAGKLYSRVHALTAELLKLAPVGTEMEHGGKRYVVRDNFAGRTAFKTCAIDQFEIKEVGAEKGRR